MLIRLTPAERITALNRSISRAMGIRLNFASTGKIHRWRHSKFCTGFLPENRRYSCMNWVYRSQPYRHLGGISTAHVSSATTGISSRGHAVFNLKTAVGREKAVQAIDVHRKFKNCVVTFWVMSQFLKFLGASKGCADFRDPTAVFRFKHQKEKFCDERYLHSSHF